MTPEQINDLRRERYNATVASMRKVHPELMVMRVRPDAPRPPHKPGQYGVLGLGFWEPRMPGCQEETRVTDPMKLARRSYSLSCSVLGDDGGLLNLPQTDWLEFYVVLVRKTDGGEAPVLTPRLFMLREGDRLYVGEKITGAYTLDVVRPDDAVVFLATGTGEAPHNYMLWDLLRRGHQGRIASACCVRYAKDLAYRDMHQELMRRYPNYNYISLTTREASDSGHKVYIQDLISSGQLETKLGQALDPARTHVFLCGNPKMIGVPDKDRQTGQRVFPPTVGVIEMLEKRGFQADQANIKFKGNIHYEEYW